MSKLTLPEVKFWLDEAAACERRQRVELFQRNNYPALILYYEGFTRTDKIADHVGTRSQMAIINEHFPNTNAKISEIMYKNPDIVAEALKPEAEEAEGLMKSAINYFSDKTDLLTENRVALFDMLYAGYCGVDVDHLITNEAKSMLETREELSQRQGVMEKIKNVFRPANAEEAEGKLEQEAPPDEDAYAMNGETFVRRWNPTNILFDWKAERLKDRRYSLKRIEISKAEFDMRYPKFKDKVSDGHDKFGHHRFPYGQHFHEIHNKKVVMYEFQIKKRKNEYWTLIVAPSWGMEEIDLFKRPYTTNGYNLKIGTLHKYGKIYPVSFAQISKKMADEMNHYVKFVMEHAERNVPKFVTNKQKVKIDAKEALRSGNINDLVEIDGSTTGAVTPLQPTVIAPENKELIAIFDREKAKLWGVSTPKLQGASQAEFATELQIQEAGFQITQADIQEGLRQLIVEELDTGKDIIITFWDDPIFLKITSGPKPQWYVPQMGVNPLTGREMVLNPLSDVLTGDYFIKVDIRSAFRPNPEKDKADLIILLDKLAQPNITQLLALQGRVINADFIDKIVRKFNVRPENLFAPLPQGGLEQISGSRV